MATFSGTIKKNDLEGGFWELVADDGQRYQLEGGGDDLRVEGQKVVVEGDASANTMGIGMVGGGVLKVSSWKTA